ncbi:MAG: YitT family protein [Clostridia bacterium]|nr:YitT family protein [Clostridia bacterium]
MANSRKNLLEYGFIVLAAIASTLTYLLFIVNNRFAPAGVGGILTMIQYKTGVNLGAMTLLVNLPLCIGAFIFTDREFAKKTSVFCVADGFSYLALSRIDLSAFAYNAGGVDVILPALIAAVLGGIIYGTVFRRGGSTGGVDIIAKLIDQKLPHFGFIWIIFALDALVAIISYFVYYEVGADGSIIYNFKPVALCILYSFVSARVASSILGGYKSAIKVEIITENPDTVAREIMDNLRRGVTSTEAVGMYAGGKRKLLICIISRHQLIEMTRLLQNQKNTFAYTTPVNEIVVGDFSRKAIKTHKKG